MPCDTVDVLIVGAGPAGCVAATVLHDVGARILLCDGSASRRRHDPDWIETYGPAVISVANALRLERVLVAATIGTVRRFVRDGKTSILTSDANVGTDLGHVHVDRSLFDARMREQVIAAGIPTTRAYVTAVEAGKDDVRCTFADQETITARVVLDATGRGRSISKGSRELLSPPLLVTTGASASCLSSDDATRFRSHDWGWIWSTGFYEGREHWIALSSAYRPPPSQITKLSAASTTGSVIKKVATWQLSFDALPRILPIGDASGSLDPASGSGISNAFATAIAASKVALEIIAGDERAFGRSDEFHDWRKSLLLRQADELTRRYAASGILQAEGEKASAA